MLPWASLILSYAGFTALALAMPRHHEELWGGKPGPLARRLWQAGGALALLASLILALATWPNAPVAVSAWAGLLTLAAFALAMVLTRRNLGGHRALVLAPPALALGCGFLAAVF
ncbi:DUF3325 family protein [Xinfangfangia sp. D13-10-4-6]|nr:DUF3325 family protein [Pseudogemmobacter hezensis]